LEVESNTTQQDNIKIMISYKDPKTVLMINPISHLSICIVPTILAAGWQFFTKEE
jgi:hypothetical protein